MKRQKKNKIDFYSGRERIIMKKLDERMYKLCITSLIIVAIITGLTWFCSSPLIGSVNRG